MEKDIFNSCLTENVMRTSRVVALSESKLIQGRGEEDRRRRIGSTSFVTGTPVHDDDDPDFGRALRSPRHACRQHGGQRRGDGTVEHPYVTLTLADADAVKRNIVYLCGEESVQWPEHHACAAGQQLLGDSKAESHNVIQTDQRGTITLPHASNGATKPLITNPGGAIGSWTVTMRSRT